jgi:hypothetical protein
MGDVGNPPVDARATDPAINPCKGRASGSIIERSCITPSPWYPSMEVCSAMHISRIASLAAMSFAVAAFAQSKPTATLSASDESFGASLGNSVSISGSTVAAGSPNALVNGQNQGAIYVYTKVASAPWGDMTESARLVTPAGHAGLGTYVAMSGDANTIVSTATGGIFVFVKPDGGWQGTILPVATMSPGPPQKPWVLQGTLGSVAINSKGDTVVSGAYKAGTQGHLSEGKNVAGVPEQGAVYLWVEPAGGWANASGAPQTAKLTASDGAADDHYGWAVGISTNTVVATAPGRNGGKGAAYLYTRPATGIWRDSARFKSEFSASDGIQNDAFGASVAVGNSGALVAVGSSRGCGNSPGSAYVFVRPANWWSASMTQTAELIPSDNAGGCFGQSIAIGSQLIVVGATSALHGEGVAYSFAQPEKGWADLSIPANLVGDSGSANFGASDSVGGRSMALGAPFATVAGTPGGAVYIFSN